jgi:thiamine biosynthesis lipoprotein
MEGSMAEPEPPQALPANRPKAPPSDRRQFLVKVGLLAGAAALPFAARLARRPQAPRLETARPALGTWVRVVVQDGDGRRAARAAERAFEAIGLVDRQMSIHREDSQLTVVNRAAGRGTVPVDAAVLDVVSRAVDASTRSDGLYDPTILPMMKLFGFYGSGRDRYPSDRDIAAVLDVTGSRHVILDRSSGRLGLAKEGAALDLGSIGKGWALDRAVDAIRAEGVESALVDVGGNVYGLGSPDEGADGWNVALFHPTTGQVDRVLVLRDRAVATSANTEQTRVLGHLRVGHLFDARRGRPAHGHASATVVARTGVESDLLSTVAFLVGPGAMAAFPAALETHFIG